MPEVDEIDLELLKNRIIERNKILVPLVGDFVIFPNNKYRRFTYDWGNDIQTTVGPDRSCYGDESFYLESDGYSSFSGSLDHAIMKDKLILTNEIRNGSFWFFHHDHPCAHSAVRVNVPCKVYRYEK